MDVNSINDSSLYFSAAQQAAKAQANASGANRTQKKESVKKSSFSSALERSREEAALLEAGLPVELAGMDVVEAAIKLKDMADEAADRLRESQMPDVFADYRRKVSQLLRFIEKNNFEVSVHQRKGFTRQGKPRAPQVQIQIINKDLDDIARMMLSSHRDTLNMLAKLDEIQGLLIDLLAA